MSARGREEFLPVNLAMLGYSSGMTGQIDGDCISDGVVLLKPFTEADITPHVAGEDDEQRHWLWNDVNLHSTEEKFARVLERWSEEWRTRAGHRAWGIRELQSDVLVGSVDIRDRGDGSVNVATAVYPDYRGRGYATRAVVLAAQYARDSMGLMRAVAIIDAENGASRRAAAKAGFVFDGPAESWEYGAEDATGVMLRYVLHAG
jgi:RimJ/RimL family protein N-acetyltransferase